MQPTESYPDSVRLSPLAQPPRPVPWLIQLQVLFGGYFNQFGWFFFSFGMVFVWLFVGKADLTSWYRFRGKLETAPGRVTASSDTHATEGGGKHSRGTPIYKNEFSFVVDDQEYHGTAFATGRELPIGSAVTVEYVPGKPTVARLKGMRSNVFGPEVVFVILFPVVGLVVLSFGFLRGLKGCYLLAYGIPTIGRLVSKTPTNVSVNHRSVYKFTFVFKTLEGELCTATVKTSLPCFENTAEEHIVYDPRKPHRALTLDCLPGVPEIGDDGHIVSAQPAKAISFAVIPLATIVGHGFWAFWLLTH